MVQYIDKAAVKAELERRKRTWQHQDQQYVNGDRDVCDYLLGFIDTLEVKEGVVSNDTLSNDLDEAARKAGQKYFPDEENIWARPNYEAKKAECAFMEGAQWQKEYLWKDAQGDNLPEIDREVIVLVKALPEHEDSLLKVAFAHRPPEYWEGKNIITGEITRYKPKRYDKGEWNIPDVKYWIDIDLPKV